MANQLGIRGYDYVEFYVGSAKMVAYWYAKAMGFDIIGYRGPETGSRDRCSYLLKNHQIYFLITSALRPETYEIHSFLTQHGDGVKRWSLSVENVKKAFEMAIRNGGIPVSAPTTESDEHGSVEHAALRLYDDAEIVLIHRDNYKGIFRPGFSKPIQDLTFVREESGLVAIDHIVGNVRTNEMNRWETYFNQVFDFETFIEFGPGDISTKYSALLSKVVRSKDVKIRNPINEPYEGLKKSQIEEYLDEYRGSGIQHIAIATEDIVKTIRALRKNGVEFLSVPSTYYEMLREKKVLIQENIDDLEECGILCDTQDVAGEGYLLQLFTKPIGDRPSFFFEIIQRRNGSQGFGQGNFQALFESIERDQERRGNL